MRRGGEAGQSLEIDWPVKQSPEYGLAYICKVYKACTLLFTIALSIKFYDNNIDFSQSKKKTTEES